MGADFSSGLQLSILTGSTKTSYRRCFGPDGFLDWLFLVSFTLVSLALVALVSLFFDCFPPLTAPTHQVI